MRTLPFVLSVVLAGCEIGTDTLEPYYPEDGVAPTVSAVDPASEIGNVGGGTATIRGGGFGTDTSQIVVQFGDHTAEVQSLSDTEIVVKVPTGPMTGGEVKVRVGTPSGYTDGTYSYTLDAPTDQVAYIQVNNYFWSCLGGTGNPSCGEVGYVGTTGLGGLAERLTFTYPRLQAPTQGYTGGQVDSPDEWAVVLGGGSTYPFATEDLYANIGEEVKLVNTSAYAQKQDPYCPNLDGTAVYLYPGGTDGALDPVAVQGAYIPAGEDCGDGEAGYSRSELDFCQRDNEFGVPTNIYVPDWPVLHDFFAADKESDELVPVDILLTASGVGLTDVPISLPEPVTFYNTEGIDDGDETTPGADIFWDIPSTDIVVDHCFSDSGGSENLDDVAMRFEWAPSKVELSTGGAIESARTYVRMSLSMLSYGWFGGVDYPVVAVLTVDDKHDYDKTTKMSSLELPSSVLYQIPTTILPVSGENVLSASHPYDGLLFMELQRVTEYTMVAEDGKRVVFQYVTGSFTYFDWTNPLDDECHDCLDGDDDGWIDDEDPDCSSGGASEVGYGDDACNDGVDNDGDGREDSRDENCSSASDKDESNCDNNLDDDGDDLKDEDDPDCQEGGSGNEDSVPQCEDTTDNDADGWVDADDPDCLSGTEEVGLGLNACNDGVDNDADGLSDHDDPQCVDAADADESNCDDGVDNDGDGLTDAEDDECMAGGNEATLVTGCSDGLDGDGDGWVDGADPDCLVGTEELDFGTTQCNDSIDNDVDGTTDIDDPDCADAADDDESA